MVDGASNEELIVGASSAHFRRRTVETMDQDRPNLFQRALRFLGLRKPPPDIGVREPRRPVPSASGGAVSLEEPEPEERK
jgi:hypothetical protein